MPYPKLGLGHVHPLQPVRFHRLAYLRRHRPKVFANYRNTVVIRLQTQHCVQLFGGVVHVDALFCTHPVRDPIETVQAHDVVDPEHGGHRHVVTQGVDEGTVSLLAKRSREHRPKPPVLACALEPVRWGPHIHSLSEQSLSIPGIEAIRMHSHGVVEVESHAVVAEVDSRRVDLGGGEPLGEEVIAVLVSIDGFHVDRSAPLGFRPRLPIGARPSLECTEASVAFDMWVAGRVRLNLGPGGAGRPELCLDRLTLACRDRPVVHQRFAPEALGTGRWEAFRPGVELVPAGPAHGCVGTGLERVVEEGREERQGADEACAFAAHEFAEVHEVQQIAGSRIAAGAEGI